MYNIRCPSFLFPLLSISTHDVDENDEKEATGLLMLYQSVYRWLFGFCK